MVIVIWNLDFVCRFSEYDFFSELALVFGIFEMGFEFNASVKIFQFFVKRGFTEIGTKFKFSFNCLKFLL